MSDVHGAADVGGDATPISVIELPSDSKATSLHDLARSLTDARKKRDETPAALAPEKAAEAAPTKSAEKADAAPPKEVSGETQEDAPEAQDEPKLRDLPRSWTKDQHEHWAKLDPAVQDFLIEQDSKANAAVRRSLNEAAEKLKGLTAKEQAVEQARQHYEQALPTLQATLQSQLSGQFSDIKTMADVEKMALEDWPRYIQWDAAQKKLAAVAQEAQAAKHRQDTDAQQKLSAFTAEQDKLFIERAPEFADKAVSAKAQDAAIKTLQDIGFTDAELGASWNGTEKFSLRDHRMQLLIRDAYRYREAMAKAKAPEPKPVPQVQRPGVSRPRGAADADRVEALSSKLDKTGSIKDAAALLRARRAG